MKKIDLHCHTISTTSDIAFEFSLAKVSEYIEKLEMDALAITNHNVFDLNQYYEIQKSVNIPIFPGIEIDLEGGHILLIADTDDFEIANFNEKCSHVSSIIDNGEKSLTLMQFKEIFSDLNKYVIIPHLDKKPAINMQIIEALSPHISSGEVASVSKFKRAEKDTSKLVPVLFSDIRFHSQLETFPTRHTYIDLDEISISGIKSCLFDREKISLTRDGGNDFFQATDEGLMLSTGLNVVIGERSSGKSVTLDKISASSGNAKYIEQFSLLQNDEEKFNDTNKARLSLINQKYLSEFREVVENVIRVDIKKNHLLVEGYLESLKKYASESEKKDLYSKCVIFNEELFKISEITNLTKLVDSVTNLIENSQYKEIIVKHLSINDLKNLATELIIEAMESQIENNKRTWLNEIVSDIQRELRIKTTGSFVEDVDFYDIALDEVKVNKFDKVVKGLKLPRIISQENIGTFSIKTSTLRIEGAADLKKISRDKTSFSSTFNNHYDNPYEYLLNLRDLEIEEASLYKYFVKIESITYNKDGFKVSGGERSEFNLIHEIQDATKYDMLLIDEPESSFDNIFLKNEINSIIKQISTLMPVVVVTHNSTVGASIKPNYIALTQKVLNGGDFDYQIYTGYPSDTELENSDGFKIKNFDAILNCLEAGIDAYDERKTKTYDILKN